MAELLNEEHGMRGYRKGCRCERCRAGNTARVLRAQRNRAQRPAPDPASAGKVTALRPTSPGNDPNPSAGQETPSNTETKVEAEIEELWRGSGRPWDARCASLEHQALCAARAIDTATTAGKIHLTPPQWRILREAVRELRIRFENPAVPGPAEDEDDFLAGLRTFGLPVPDPDA